MHGVRREKEDNSQRDIPLDKKKKTRISRAHRRSQGEANALYNFIKEMKDEEKGRDFFTFGMVTRLERIPEV